MEKYIAILMADLSGYTALTETHGAISAASMYAIIIGISSGLLIILLFCRMKHLDKKIIYGLILSGIGFLYVGFAWTDLQSLIATVVQAIFLLFFAYYGVKKNLYILATGYFSHGSWDLLYKLIPAPDLIPPHYDLFCLSIDFTLGFYIIWFNYKTSNKLIQSRSAVKSLL